MRLLSWALSLPVVAIILIFVLHNRELVSISFWPFDARVALPISFLALGLLAVGFLAGLLVAGAPLLCARWRIRGLNKQVDKLNNRLTEDSEACQPPASATIPTYVNQGRYCVVPDNDEPNLTKKRWFERTRK